MKISLLSVNLWLLPPPASIDNQARLEKFIDLTLELDPDIVNLQEVWLNKYKKFIKDNLRDKYYAVYPRSLVYNRSGLMTLVKGKPRKTKFHTFDSKSVSALEKVASKGILYTRTKILGNEIIVINTHLNETREESKFKIAVSQAENIFSWAKKHNPTIISGDFNLEKETVWGILEDFKAEENLDETYSLKNKYARMGAEFFRNKQGVNISRPDHVFANIKHREASVSSKVLNDVMISDHYPIWAEITVPEEKQGKTRGFLKRAFGR